MSITIILFTMEKSSWFGELSISAEYICIDDEVYNSVQLVATKDIQLGWDCDLLVADCVARELLWVC